MTREKHSYEPDDAIVAGVVREGSVVAYAASVGIPGPTLDSRITKRGLRDRVRSELAKANAEAQQRRASEAASRSESDDEVSELEILKQRNRELEASLRQNRAEDVRLERVIQRLERVIPSVKPKYSPLSIPKHVSSDGKHEFALLFSDTHADEVVTSEGTLGLNEYNYAVMLKRMAKLQQSVLSYQANRPYPISKLHVWMLGDMLSGDIHDELSITNESTVEETTVQLASDIGVWLEEFVPHFGEIDVCGVPGNHPRKTKKPSMKQPQNNSDWTMYQTARIWHRQNPAITWNLPTANMATTRVCDRWNTLLMHGDGIRSSMPGVPWGGVIRRVTVLEQQFNAAKQPLDYIAMGHFHTANALDGVGTKTFVNGSVKGTDEYSLKQFGSGRPPCQLLLTFHPEHGVTDVSYIDL